MRPKVANICTELHPKKPNMVPKVIKMEPWGDHGAMWILARRLSEKLIFNRARSQKVPKIVPKSVKMEPWGRHEAPFGAELDPKDPMRGSCRILDNFGRILGAKLAPKVNQQLPKPRPKNCVLLMCIVGTALVACWLKF